MQYTLLSMAQSNPLICVWAIVLIVSVMYLLIINHQIKKAKEKEWYSRSYSSSIDPDRITKMVNSIDYSKYKPGSMGHSIYMDKKNKDIK